MAIRTDFTAGEVLAAADLNDTFASKLNLAGAKILQIVRDTDTTDRTTTSTSFVDVTGMSVTITPQKSDSAILVCAIFDARGSTTTTGDMHFQITDSSNNAISGAQDSRYGVTDARELRSPVFLLAYATPATTSATTYKLRFRCSIGTVEIRNSTNSTGQLYAIEVSA
jgi:hypothetical protein